MYITVVSSPGLALFFQGSFCSSPTLAKQTKMYDVKGLTVGQGSFRLYALLALMAEARACLNMAGTGGALPVLIYEQVALCFVQALPVLIYELIALCFVQALRLGISMQEI